MQLSNGRLVVEHDDEGTSIPNAECVTLLIDRSFRTTPGVFEVTLLKGQDRINRLFLSSQSEITVASGLVGSSRGDSKDRDVCIETKGFVEALY